MLFQKGKNNIVKRPEIRKKISEAMKGKKHSEEHKKNIGLTMSGVMKKRWENPQFRKKFLKSRIGFLAKEKHPNWGKHHSEETRKKMSEALRGEKGANWKGGISLINEIIRKSLEYKLWREAVFKRDNYTCIWCGLKFIKGITGNVELQADHIKPFVSYPELRFAIDNGRTLCISCHRKTDTWGNNNN